MSADSVDISDTLREEFDELMCSRAFHSSSPDSSRPISKLYGKFDHYEDGKIFVRREPESEPFPAAVVEMKNGVRDVACFGCIVGEYGIMMRIQYADTDELKCRFEGCSKTCTPDVKIIATDYDLSQVYDVYMRKSEHDVEERYDVYSLDEEQRDVPLGHLCVSTKTDLSYICHTCFLAASIQ